MAEEISWKLCCIGPNVKDMTQKKKSKINIFKLSHLHVAVKCIIVCKHLIRSTILVEIHISYKFYSTLAGTTIKGSRNCSADHGFFICHPLAT